eukprot:CAMPEP_0116942070 /NCGR_PEP_ID=MMETSP0467-20121206/34375_1 /TAXON_ID=283647 /ORGANISM="Mesodinium pulex, Strain SPMC105" /LENGTH=215 /DNA_ID=CAMNT_0004624995 /DNA_START=47 /DNA_END=694 /DNA_ORIENTATION=-
MTVLRDANTHPSDFRRVLKEITFYLGYEATRDLKVSNHVITTPMDMPFTGCKVSEKIAIIPILRAGLTMSESMLELMPKAAVHHIGMYRSKSHGIPIQYYNRLPRDQACDVAYIVDPCIASSNTVSAVVSILKKWGAKRVVIISAIAAQSGLDKLLEKHPDCSVFVGAVDNEVSETGMILPGIGDAGDRSFGTPMEDKEVVAHVDESPARKKSRK